MPDLGKYADAVLSAYGVTSALLLVLVLVSLRKGRQVRDELDQIENLRDPRDG